MLRRSPRALVFLVLAVALLATACQVDTTVDITVDDDGSGRVTVTVVLDAEAAAKVPDLDQSLLLDDVRKAGWRVVGPDRTAAGGWRVSATKPFADPSQLPAVMAELGGEGGPFREFTLTRDDAFAKTSYRLEGTVDLSGGIDAFGDDALRQALGGTTTGRTPEQLAADAGRPLPEALRFEVRTHLPGGGTEEWTPVLGQPAQQIEASSASRRPRAWLFGFAAALAAAGFLGTRLPHQPLQPHEAPTLLRPSPRRPEAPLGDRLSGFCVESGCQGDLFCRATCLTVMSRDIPDRFRVGAGSAAPEQPGGLVGAGGSRVRARTSRWSMNTATWVSSWWTRAVRACARRLPMPMR